MADSFLAKLEERVSGRKIFQEYKHEITDATIPPGPDNMGPYRWQMDFHNAGVDHPERLLLGANRVGKTRIGSAEVAIHATGEYPKWWEGRRFDNPVHIWTGAETNEDSRDIIQKALLGEAGEHGTGWIPRSRLIDVKTRQAGITEVAERIFVKHKTGGVSWIGMKTYHQEARGWRGETLDVVWADELIPMDIYTEALTRLIDRKGVMLVTFTPMEGPSDVVRHFLEAKKGSGIYVKNVDWGLAPHLDPVERERMAKSYPEHERDARTKGKPMLGSGAIFPISDESITIPPMPIPTHWARINGMDFGIDHPGAGAFCAWDKDADTFYIYDCYKQSGQTPVYHAAAMKKHGTWIPNAWPHDGNQREIKGGSLISLKDMFRKDHDLKMLREHAQYLDERKNSREASLIEMYEWMRTGRLKVFSTCTELMEEKRMYHRKDGKVVDKFDDILSAARYAFMMRRYAQTKPVTLLRQKFKGPVLGGKRWTRRR